MIVRPDLCPLAQLSGIQSIEMIILHLKTSLRQYYSVVIQLEHLAPHILYQLSNTGWVIILRDYVLYLAILLKFFTFNGRDTSHLLKYKVYTIILLTNLQITASSCCIYIDCSLSIYSSLIY